MKVKEVKFVKPESDFVKLTSVPATVFALTPDEQATYDAFCVTRKESAANENQRETARAELAESFKRFVQPYFDAQNIPVTNPTLLYNSSGEINLDSPGYNLFEGNKPDVRFYFKYKFHAKAGELSCISTAHWNPNERTGPHTLEEGLTLDLVRRTLYKAVDDQGLPIDADGLTYPVLGFSPLGIYFGSTDFTRPAFEHLRTVITKIGKDTVLNELQPLYHEARIAQADVVRDTLQREYISRVNTSLKSEGLIHPTFK